LTRSAVFLLAALGSSRIVSAQNVHPYVGGGIEMSSFGTHSWEGSPSLSFDNATDDSIVIGLGGEGGVFLGTNVAVGAEVNVPFGRGGITQSHGYFNPYSRLSRYREWSLFGIFHGYVPAGRRVRAGLLAGAGIVFASSLDRYSFCQFSGTPVVVCQPFTAEQEATRSTLGATLGGDVVIQATHRLSVVPGFRVVRVGRGGDLASSGYHDFIDLGLDRLVYRAGIAIRATF
jgi:hypothetical protein